MTESRKLSDGVICVESENKAEVVVDPLRNASKTWYFSNSSQPHFRTYLAIALGLGLISITLVGISVALLFATKSSSEVDSTIDPCDNFYEFACQSWLLDNPRPDHKSIWNVAYKLEDRNTDMLTDLLWNATTSRKQEVGGESALEKAKLFFATCMESGEVAEKEKSTFLNVTWNTLESLGGWPILYEPGTWNSSRFDFSRSLIFLKKSLSLTRLFDMGPQQNESGNIEDNRIFFKPVFSTYNPSSFQTEEDFLTNNFVNCSRELLRFKGALNINETFLKTKSFDIARVASKLLKLPDYSLNLKLNSLEGIAKYTDKSVKELQEMTDKFVLPHENRVDLAKLLHLLYENSGVEISESDSLQIEDIDYVLRFAKIVSSVNQETLANFLHYTIAFQMVHTTEQLAKNSDRKPRKRFCSKMTQLQFPDVVAHEYRRNNPTQLTKAREMFDGITNAWQGIILSSESPFINKTLLLTKLENTQLYLGCPFWSSDASFIDAKYSELTLFPDNFLEQLMIVNAWTANKELIKLQLSYNKTNALCLEEKIPLKVEAISDIKQQSVYISLGLLQPPYLDLNLSDAMNYGALGSTLGHEIVHGMDGIGLYEFENVSLTPDAQCLVDQYGNFTKHISDCEKLGVGGYKTLIENIADNAGLMGAYKTFKTGINGLSELSNGEHGTNQPEEAQPYSDDQLFFLGFAQKWCSSKNEAGWREIIEKDAHAPTYFRVMGSLINSPEFAAAWKCPIGSSMNPRHENAKRCSIF